MNSGKLTKQSSKGEIDAFLCKVAQTPASRPSGTQGRLIFAMDATASRKPTWDTACYIQGQMFQQTAALGGLAVQLSYYRGFDEFHTTSWLTDATKLLAHMSAVSCRGGHTQIQRLLQHAFDETKRKKVNALVFVGDCMEEDADHLCHLAGELGLMGVPVFIFQEGQEPLAKRTFQEITRLTKGAYCPFDSGSADQLRDLLSAVAVYAAGGQAALQALGQRKGGNVLLLTRQMEKR